VQAQVDSSRVQFPANSDGGMIFLFILLIIVLLAAIFLKIKTSEAIMAGKRKKAETDATNLNQYINSMNSNQIEDFLLYKERIKNQEKKQGKNFNSNLLSFFFIIVAFLNPQNLFAQSSNKSESLLNEGGIVITIVLILTPILAGIILMIVKVKNVLRQYNKKQNFEESEKLAAYLKTLPGDEIKEKLIKRKAALDYKLSNVELSGELKADDNKGLINIGSNSSLPVVAIKKKALKRPNIDPQLSKLILWYIGAATFWLVVLFCAQT
jgi:cytochrome c oxidase cbb3-type subunit 1